METPQAWKHGRVVFLFILPDVRCLNKMGMQNFTDCPVPPPEKEKPGRAGFAS
jgi:hypothetical protein